MADYWKSIPKKYCKLCQCWITENKISVQNHENGSRHKANVEKKMNELTRANKDSKADKKKLEQTMQKINDSAHSSMMKDIQKDPSLAKRYGITIANEHLLEKKNEHVTSTVKDNNKDVTAVNINAANKSTSDENLKQAVWRECVTQDGKHYYWNTVTHQTQWERPSGIIEQNPVSVKHEKGRVQQFLFQRLVELSESGAEGANESILRSFNVPEPEKELGIDKLDADEDTGSTNKKIKLESQVYKDNAQRFQGPKVELLGQWVACDDMCKPEPAVLKLDLVTPTKPKDEKFDEKFALISHLEETTHQSAHNFEISEKKLPSGKLNKSKPSTDPSTDETKLSNPKIVFRRPPNTQLNRSLRTTSVND